MPSPKRQPDLDVIRPLLEAPHRYEFMQAVRLLERWLAEQARPGEEPADLLRFQNSVALTFPASQIEALNLVTADDGGELERIEITPAFIGLLGASGALPIHTTERIAEYSHATRDDGPRAFHDLFFQRLMLLLCTARGKYKIALKPPDAEQAPLLRLALALSGSDNSAGDATSAIPDETAAYHAAAFRQRPSSTIALQRALAEHFAVPVTVSSNVCKWHLVEPRHRARLGGPNPVVLGRCILGARQWRQDVDVVIRIGPLNRMQFDSFLPGRATAKALKQMVAMFATPGIVFEVCLVLRAEDVKPAVLGVSRAGLGQGLFLGSAASKTDRTGTRYIL